LSQKFDLWRWDNFSDQPYQISKSNKKILRQNKKLEIFSSHLIGIFKALKNIFFYKNIDNDEVDLSNFLGVVVSLERGEKQLQLLKIANIKNVALRFYMSDMQNINLYINLIDKFQSQNIKVLLIVIQTREFIINSTKFSITIKDIFSQFYKIGITEFQIGHAPNRIKWGFVSPKEYINFFEIAYFIKEQFFANTNIQLIGSSVIDFEFHWWGSTLKLRNKLDKVSSLLYVDRRGSPENRQALFFNLDKKIWLLSRIFDKKIYITETNYPIKDTYPYTPTSQTEAISLENYKKYMIRYILISISTKKISKIYWHQLIANGYGLTAENEIYPQFWTFKILLNLISTSKYISRDFNKKFNIVRFDKFYAIWTISDSFELNLSKLMRTIDIDGNEKYLSKLEISDKPIYVF